MNSTEKKPGRYLGTELGGRWWRRYSRDGLLARGVGEYWLDASALCFQRYLVETPIAIRFGDVLEVKLGKWHSGRWAGGAPVVKIVWRKAEDLLSSGFVLSRDLSETEALVRDIRSRTGLPTVGSKDEVGDSSKHRSSYVLRVETGRFSLTGSPVGFTVEGSPDSPVGRRVETRPAIGGTAEGHTDETGAARVALSGPLARGRANESQAVKTLVKAMNACGNEVRLLTGARDERGEDQLLEVDGQRVVAQVVTIPADKSIWSDLAQAGRANVAWSLERTVEIVREALEQKRSRARDTLLVLDATHVGVMVNSRLVEEYGKRYGRVEADYGVVQCWIVGPTLRSTQRLP